MSGSTEPSPAEGVASKAAPADSSNRLHGAAGSPRAPHSASAAGAEPLGRSSATLGSLARNSRQLVAQAEEAGRHFFQDVARAVQDGFDAVPVIRMGPATGGLGRVSMAGPGDVDGHIQQDYNDLISEAVQRVASEMRVTLPPPPQPLRHRGRTGRHSMEIVLPKTAPIRAITEEGLPAPAVDEDELEDSSLDVAAITVDDLGSKEGAEARMLLLDNAMATLDQDNKHVLEALKERMDKVGLSFPTIEVVFKDLAVDSEVMVGSRGMPTVLNFFRNQVEGLLQLLHIMRPDTRPFSVLSKMSGVLKPGRLTLLLGPPGGGKSTLLRVLNGNARTGQEDLRVSGAITYNGRSLDTFNAARTAAYVPQVDSHNGELTVRETLGFAAACQGSGVMPALVAELRAREKAAGITPDPVTDLYIKALAQEGTVYHMAVDTMLRTLGLDVCADTLVGNQMIRGVSGGQRKRVTTGEYLVGPARVLLMDEISTGLDSSTTFLITRCLRNLAHMQGMTILVSLLQPPPEVYNLFDDIMVLSDGHLVFHGPRTEVAPFFASCGFRAPPRKGEGDFLQEVTSRKDQGQYWVGQGPYSYFPVAAFEAAFAKSSTGQARAAEVEAAGEMQVKVVGGNPSPVHDNTLDSADGASGSGHSGDIAVKVAAVGDSLWAPDLLVRPKFALNHWAYMGISMWREWTLVKRMPFLWSFKLFLTIFVGATFSTLMLYTTMSTDTVLGGTLYLGVLFYGIIHCMFSGYTEMAILVAQLPVYFRQRAGSFFPAWSFTLPPVLLRVPYTTVDAFVWSCLIYWVTGLAPHAGRFFIFFAYMLISQQMATGLFRMCAAVARNYDIANSFGSTSLVITMVLGGFIMIKPKIHPWWVWCYWISPVTYAQQGMSINEMKAHRWQSKMVEFRGVQMTLGDAVLENSGMFKDDYWVWLGAIVLVGYVILFNLVAYVALQFLPAPRGEPATFSEEFLAGRKANIEGGVEALAAEAEAAAQATVASHRRSVELGRSSMQGSRRGSIEIGRRGSIEVRSGTPTVPAALSQAAAPVATDKGNIDVTHQILALAGANGSSAGNDTTQDPGMALPFKPMAMCFHNMCYDVPMPRDAPGYEALAAASPDGTPQLRLLTDITGTFRPKVLTALMGVSGAGKTTLMDVLAGRKNQGTITGDVHVGGFPKDQNTFARVCGYVEQSDIHSPRTTVREALMVSGLLRLYHTDRETVENFVDQVLSLVELGPQRDALVGIPGVSGLSVEQRKRLTIAVELVANPSIVFMDEPTSGLDARAAAIVMRAVRAAVNTGRTVVCTIHQPSIEIFEAFDELLLLKRGGRTIYHGALGKHGATLISHFTSVRGITAPAEDVNPSTWMLEVSTMSNERALGVNFADVWAQSDMCKEVDAKAISLQQPAPDAQPLSFDTEFALGLWDQFKVLLRRNADQYWRNPAYNGVRYAFCIALGLLLGSIYWDMGMQRSTPTDLMGVMGALFLCITFLGTYNASGIIPVLALERPVFYRERAANMYAVIPYALAQALIEVPYVLAQSVFYGSITYWMIQFEAAADKFFWYLLFVFLTLVFFTFFGLMITSLMPVPELANIVSAMFYSIWFAFGGFFLSESRMPDWWKWYYWLDPLSYALYGIIGSQMGTVTDTYVDDGSGNPPVTVKDFVRVAFGFKYDFVWATAVIQVAYILGFLSVFVFAMWKFNFSSR